MPGQEAGTSVNRSSVPATTSGLGERRRLPARFPADVGSDNGPLCPAWAGCQGARPWPRALASASMRARGPENPGDKEARPLPETITAKEMGAQSRCASPPGPHSARVSEAGHQPAMPASRSRGQRVPTQISSAQGPGPSGRPAHLRASPPHLRPQTCLLAPKRSRPSGEIGSWG